MTQPNPHIGSSFESFLDEVYCGEIPCSRFSRGTLDWSQAKMNLYRLCRSDKFVAMLMLPIILSVCTPASAEQVIRNSTHKFRIVFPENWIENRPKGEHVVLSLSSGKPLNASCNVVVRTNTELNDTEPNQIEAELKSGFTPEEWRAMQPDGCTEGAVVESGVSYLDGRTAPFAITKCRYSSFRISIDTRQVQAMTVFEKKLYALTCSSPEEYFEHTRNVFYRIFSSLVFEDW